MVDDSFNEDMALRYVMGECSAAERIEFESRMAASVELQAFVSELQMGATVLATTSRPQCPPPVVWRNIETAVSKEIRWQARFSDLWLGWFRNGWAVAAVCIIGCLFYAFMARQPHVHAPAITSMPQNEMATKESVTLQPKSFVTKTPDANATNAAFELLQARETEILKLRGKIAELQTVTTQLSRSLVRQNALLTESNRIKFYHLIPASTGGENNAKPLSPGLQIAVLTALARDLGWLKTPSPSDPQNKGNAQTKYFTSGGVDFIDLRSGSQIVANQQTTQSQTTSGQTTANNNSDSEPGQPQTETTTASSDTTTSEPTIPAYVSGDNLVVALDSTVVPAGSSVTLTARDASQNETGGSFVLGNNPAVVTIPLSYANLPIIGFTTTTSLGISLSFTSPNGQFGTIFFSLPSSSSSP